MSLLRSLMFVPGIREDFLGRATDLQSDLVCVDLEDSVPPGDKDRARDIVQEWLPKLARPHYMLIVRVNGLDTGLLEDDLAAFVSNELEAISLPKAHTPEIVQQVDHYLTILERERGLPNGHVKMIPWIESAEAVLNAQAITRARSRLIGASIGGEDLTITLGVERTKIGKEIEWARYQVATACRAAGILPIDSPVMDFRDTEQLERESQFVRSIGFGGKYCIHPSQIEVINRVFLPSDEELSQARRIVEVYEEAEKQGLGAVGMDGLVVDRPVYVRAQNLLDFMAQQTEDMKE